VKNAVRLLREWSSWKKNNLENSQLSTSISVFFALILIGQFCEGRKLNFQLKQWKNTEIIAQPEPNNQNGYEEIMMPLNGSAEGTNNFNYNAGEILSQNGSGEESLNTIQVERPLGLEDFLISPAADKVLDDNGKKNEGQEASEKIIAEGGAGLV
jgi:hypothetical protein